MRAQFSQSSREHTGWNFHPRTLPIFVIWPNYGTCSISCDSMTASFLASSRALPNSPTLPRAHQLQFSHVNASNIRHFVHFGYQCDFARSRENQSFSVRARECKFPGPPRCAPVGIFACDRISSLTFGLIRLLERFRTIPRWSIL